MATPTATAAVPPTGTPPPPPAAKPVGGTTAGTPPKGNPQNPAPPTVHTVTDQQLDRLVDNIVRRVCPPQVQVKSAPPTDDKPDKAKKEEKKDNGTLVTLGVIALCLLILILGLRLIPEICTAYQNTWSILRPTGSEVIPKALPVEDIPTPGAERQIVFEDTPRDFKITTRRNNKTGKVEPYDGPTLTAEQVKAMQAKSNKWYWEKPNHFDPSGKPMPGPGGR